MSVSSPRDTRPWAAILIATLIGSAVWLTFAPAAGLYFHGDDFEWLAAAHRAVGTPAFDLPDDVNGHFRPAAELLWLCDYRQFGLAAGPYHVRRLMLHTLTAFLVAGFAGRLVGSRVGALIAGLVFAVNASHRSVPLWLSAAPDLILGLGAAAALTGLIAIRRRGWLAWAGFTVALLAKETGLALILAGLLVVPEAARTGRLRWAVGLTAVAVTVPHVAASLLSPYLQSRFAPGAGALLRLVELVSGLTIPAHGEGLFAAGSVPRVVAGMAALGILTLLAGRWMGARPALAWSTSAIVCLVPAAFTSGAIEPRWSYLPWVFLAPLMAAALLTAEAYVARLVGPRLGMVALVLVVGADLGLHGTVIRRKIERDLGRDAWVRSTVEGAGNQRPELEPGEVIEVIVPYGSELRAWPVGIPLAIGMEVQVCPIDHLTVPTPGVAVYDASQIPGQWRVGRERSGEPAVAPPPP